MIFYQIKFQSFLLNYSLKVNDVEVLFEEDGANLTLDFEVNEWLFLNENVVSLHLTDSSEAIPDGSQISVQLYVKHQRDVEGIKLLEIEEFPHKKNPKVVTKTFFVKELPFKTTDTKDLIKIDVLNETLVAKFISTFNEYYQLIENKELKKVMSYHKYRTGQYEDRYFEPPGTRFEELEKSLSRAFSKDYLLRRPLNCEKLNLHMYGKLITIDYRKYKIPLVTFTSKKVEYTKSYQTYWALNSKNEFFIYR